MIMASQHCRPLLLLIIAWMLIQTLRGATTLLTPHRRCDYDVEQKEADCRHRGFDSVPQNLPANVKVLKLGSNNITAILSSSFKRYPLVGRLEMYYNDIKMIESTTFYPLKKLEFLDLSYNPNLRLPDSGMLKWAQHLSYLDLSFSNLKHLPNDTLRWIPKLDDIHLNNNKLSFIDLSHCGRVKNIHLAANQIEQLTEETFKLGCRSDYLKLSMNPIKSVDPNLIASLHVKSLTLGAHPFPYEVVKNVFVGICRSATEVLSVAGQNFTVLPQGLFDLPHDCSLRVLRFHYNRVHVLYPFVFSNLSRIVELDLCFNIFVTIEPDFFQGMHDLRVLRLCSNEIRYVNPNNDVWKTDLNVLDLSDNYMLKVSEFTFTGLYNLALLDMRRNTDLHIVEITSYSKLTGIQTIDLSFCRLDNFQLVTPNLKSLYLNRMMTEISTEPGTMFKDSQHLVHLEIRKSGLSSSSLWHNNVSLFDGLSNLTTLDLSYNSFVLFSEGDLIFKPLTALQTLGLEGCHISFLHPLTFVGLKSLRKLNLRGNTIQQLHFNSFMWLSQIITIDLGGNLLANLDEQIFLNNPRLTTLLLSNNKIISLHKSTFQPIKSSLSSIDLSMNPISCNCDLGWFLDWVRGPLNVSNEDITFCSSASLAPLREKPLLDFDPDKFCGLDIALVCLTPIAVITVIVVVIVVRHNRWSLNYKLFLLKLAVVGYKKMQDARDPNDYEFDVNIIFYDDDKEWILQHFRPALEEKLPQYQRYVFGDEDLPLGMHYLDAVDYVVRMSYKTVIVLSRAAVRDRWFMLKLRIAMEHVSDTGTEFVVALFLEDFPDDEIPFLARLYLSDGRPYLHWTEDERGQEYLWDKLAKILTINLRTNDLIPDE